jgi:FkbH-like protein
VTLADLPWLPPAPDDLRARLRALPDTSPAAALIALSTFALDDARLRQAASALATLCDGSPAPPPLVSFTLGIASSFTIGHLIPALIGSALRYGIALQVIAAEYGQLHQSAHDPASSINTAGVDAVLVLPDSAGIGLVSAYDDASEATATVDAALRFVDELRAGFRRHAGAPSIVATLPVRPEALFGSLDRAVPGTAAMLADAFNAQLAQRVRAGGDVLFDVATLAAAVGTDAWHSARDWNLAKFPFDTRFVPLWADHVARLIGAMRGKSRRVLVLDLDNTLWGGVVGDDGPAGIIIGQGDPTGEAHLDLQRYALALRERGVILAVCSKNDDAIARSVFRDHQDMLLREEHVAVFQANWNDKATNLRAIARALNLGLDALVLLDDNPAERALVRELVPEVAVPELPADPAGFVRTLAAAGYFEAISFSADDRHRAAFYAQNAQRAAIEAGSENLDAYLASLEMTLDVRPFDAAGRPRIVSLINKTNQFNLTTRRYTDPEVAALEADPNVFTLAARLIDRFGDNGMICVVIARRLAGDLEIDTWLMSCRVLGRRVEEMVLREVLAFARERGCTQVVGVYRPTARNGIVAGLYERLGFRRAGEESNGEVRWTIDAGHEVPEAPMKVVRR